MAAGVLCCALQTNSIGQPFTNTGIAFPYTTVAAWGDYDTDGDPDLLTAGGESRILRNDRISFSITVPDMPGGAVGSVVWGDYDRDGDLDALTGTRESGVRLYRNDSNGVFAAISGDFPTGESSVTWGDFDNDGDLDFIAVGTPYTETRIFRNDGADHFTSVGTSFPACIAP